MAMTGTSEWRLLMAVMGVVALIVGGGIGGAEAQGAPPQSSGCTSSLVSLSPCLSYVTGNGSFSRPSQGCCSALASVVKTSAACLCQLVSSTGNPLGIPVNRTTALSLPGACKITTPPLSQCKAAAAPAQAPAAPGGSSPARANGGPTPAAAPAPSTAQTPNSNTIPSANSPSSSLVPSRNIPPTTTEEGNIPSQSPKGTSGGVTVFTPPMVIVSVFVGVISAIVSIGF